MKYIGRWKSGIGQLLAYGHCLQKHRLRLHLFGNSRIKQFEKMISICREFNISVTHDMGLEILPKNIVNLIHLRKYRDHGVDYLRKKMKKLQTANSL